MSQVALWIGGHFTESMAPTRPQFTRSEIEFEIAVSKDGKTIWLYDPENGAHTYCSGGKGSRGFGGSTVSFKLSNERGTINLVGPWHSNADDLFEETDIDVRDKFWTWGCVATGREYDSNSGLTRLTNIIDFDTNWKRGEFYRFEYAVRQMANDMGQDLYYYCQSEGGSTLGMMKANERTVEQERARHAAAHETFKRIFGQ